MSTAAWHFTDKTLSQNIDPAVLRAFARRCALDVLHLWPDAPAIVREYLETGDESIRSAAESAVRDASLAVEMDDASMDDAAMDAAMDAAWVAASDADKADAWDAARNAAISSAWATESDAWDAAWADAWDAARDAALSKYDGWLVEMVEAAR